MSARPRGGSASIGHADPPKPTARTPIFRVASRRPSLAANACESPVYTRVDSFNGWIREQAAYAAELSGIAAPAWVTPPQARPGTLGDPCASASQCGESFTCLPTGAARECTVTDCVSCPDGFLCDETSLRCLRDPSVAPAPVDAGAPPPADVPATDAAAPVEAGAGAAPTAAATSTSCAVGRVGDAERQWQGDGQGQFG